ncbi:MAG: type II toxin-antitoxin system RelE/ParE family toxin [Oscillospiraceae bacterium]|nr:type II toxin-antitoxin system RelE/ParE family toxin [Oscillospiraceae bacterium]
MFEWEFNHKAEKQFSKLDTTVRKRLLKWLNTNISDCDNPRLFGRALEGELGNFWRYKIGKYRIIAEIKDDIFTVTVVKTGKREDVYKSHN